MNTITVKKARKSFEVDFDTLPQVSKDYVIQYGLTQILNDSVSQGKNPKDYAGAQADNHAMDNYKTVNHKLDNLRAGVIRLARVSGGANPLEAEARRIAINFVKSHKAYIEWLAKAGLKPSAKAATDKLRELALKHAAKETTIAQAKKNLEAIESMDDELEVD